MRRRWPWAVGLFVGVLLTCLFVLWYRQAPKASTDVLRWGADAGGGAPYVYDENGKTVGFEVDLAAELARRLGLRPQFVQKSWDMLPQDLQRGDIDIILNGYEWSPARERQMASTVPYYVAGLQLMVRSDRSKDPNPVNGWDDLHRRNKNGSKKKVGVLQASASENYVRREFGDDVDVVALQDEGTTGAMEQVVNRSLDATVQDELTAGYYVEHDFKDKLEIVGPKVALSGEGYYVIFTRRSDAALRERLNAALRDMMKDGTLKAIYKKQGIWNEAQERLADVSLNWPPPVTDTAANYGDFAWLLVQSAGVTALLAGLAFPLAVVVGLLVALGRLYGPRWLAAPLSGYVELLRGTPVLLQLFVIYYLLPYAGIFLQAFWAGVIGLAINYSAYEAENYRAGLLAVPRGQMEAALALGMSRWTALRRVIVPQAMRIVVPPVTNDFISLFKDTSVCSVVAVTELTGAYRRLVVANPSQVLYLAAMTALLYLLMSYPLSLVARRLEKRFPKVVV